MTGRVEDREGGRVGLGETSMTTGSEGRGAECRSGGCGEGRVGVALAGAGGAGIGAVGLSCLLSIERKSASSASASDEFDKSQRFVE